MHGLMVIHLRKKRNQGIVLTSEDGYTQSFTDDEVLGVLVAGAESSQIAITHRFEPPLPLDYNVASCAKPDLRLSLKLGYSVVPCLR